MISQFLFLTFKPTIYNSKGKRSEIYLNFDRNCCNDTRHWKVPFSPALFNSVF